MSGDESSRWRTFANRCAGLGWENVATYIQSGNVVFDADCSPAAAEAAIEDLIRKHHGYEAPAIVRTRDQWAKYRRTNPFPEAARDTPNYLLMLIVEAADERRRRGASSRPARPPANR